MPLCSSGRLPFPFLTLQSVARLVGHEILEAT